MNTKEILGLIIRYLIAIILGLGIGLIYKILTPLTVYPIYFILKELNGAVLIGESRIFWRGVFLDIVPACVAGSAYYLLLLLNLITPMKLSNRLMNIIFLIISFFIINLIRIFILIYFYSLGIRYFDLAHKFMWYFGSTAAVIILWFIGIWIFQIKNIPIYGDIKNILKLKSENATRIYKG
ncbi:MAG: pacearchaeosortase [Nanoarchaeota archaeon]|nr:pacearchaeosortase [Nanoarchaeota archaeon]